MSDHRAPDGSPGSSVALPGGAPAGRNAWQVVNGWHQTALVCAGLVVVGAFSPWVDFYGLVRKNGIQGDGLLALGGGLAAALVLWFDRNPTRRGTVAALLFVAVCTVLVWDVVSLRRVIEGTSDDPTWLNVGLADILSWGFYVTGIAAVGGLIAAWNGRDYEPAAADLPEAT